MNIIRASFGADVTANVSLFSKASMLLNLTLKTTVEVILQNNIANTCTFVNTGR